MYQKIAEFGMTANQAPGPIDWEIIPDGSIFGDWMEVDEYPGDWEDMPENFLGLEGQTISQKAMQRARLQTIIAYVVFLCCAASLIAF